MTRPTLSTPLHGFSIFISPKNLHTTDNRALRGAYVTQGKDLFPKLKAEHIVQNTIHAIKEMEQPIAHFGEHVTLDGYDGDYELLNSEALVQQSLSELPGLLGMDKLAEPVVYFAEGNDTKDPGGWSGVVVIKESHISIHTFPGRKFVSADVYTCKNGMDVEFIEEYFKKTFGLQEVETNFIVRGKHYPAYNLVTSAPALVG